MMTDKRRATIAQRIEEMGRFKPLAGATVLEIGADQWGVAAEMLLAAGAGRVISTNYAAKWTEETKGALERRKVDARRLEDSLEPDSVDVIFGIAVLEHINGLPDFFAGAGRVLKPGGLFFLHGGPIWSFAKGHHLFLNGGTRKYRFSDPQANPIPNWAHLIHTRASLTQAMAAAGVPQDDAELIGRWVYDDEGINRVGFNAMCAAFEACGLDEVDRQINAFAGPSPEMLGAIEAGPHGGHGRYDVSGITFVARA